MTDEHNDMMALAMVLYNGVDWSIEEPDRNRNRCEISEALVGEWIENGRQVGKELFTEKDKRSRK